MICKDTKLHFPLDSTFPKESNSTEEWIKK